MPSWWGKSSKEVKKKTSKESIVDTFNRRFKSPSEGKLIGRFGVFHRRHFDTISEKGCRSQAESRSSSPSKYVSRCQSFAERSHAQPLPLPSVHHSNAEHTGTGTNMGVAVKSRSTKNTKSLFLPLPRPSCIRYQPHSREVDRDFVGVMGSSESSTDTDDPSDSTHQSPLTCDYDRVVRTNPTSPSRSSRLKNKSSAITTQSSTCEPKKPDNLSLSVHNLSTSPKWRPSNNCIPSLSSLHHGVPCSAPDSSLSSPSRSPRRVLGADQVINSGLLVGKPYSDVGVLGSGQCSSPGSGCNSGNNSMGGDVSGQLFWQQGKGSDDCSPIPSPRMTSPGPSSRVQSGAVTPTHPRMGGTMVEPQANCHEEGKKQSHRLPLPPITISNVSPFAHSNSAAMSPLPRSPGKSDNPLSPGSRWKKGKMLGRGTFGHVYVGFNSESGEMCAMKEVTLFSDDAKSKESAKQLMQEIALLSRLRHPNIVQYYGSDTDGDRLYIYLEYVSGGSIYKLLQDYGQLGEVAIRNYTHQILAGLAYLHSKSTVHRDIKGANILVDPNGRVKLADFGMAKHISGQSCPLSLKGSPYWMAPEVIKNTNGCNLAVDIWSLGCTVLEMATTKPPWSQFEGVAAMFKIGNSKDLPSIPDHLSDDGKDFVRLCLQRNPMHRPTAIQLLEHPFVKSAMPLDRHSLGQLIDRDPVVASGVKTLGSRQARKFANLDTDMLAVHSTRVSRVNRHPSDVYGGARNISCPVSPIGSPLLQSKSPQFFNGRMTPSPISSPRAIADASTPPSGGCGAVPYNYVIQSPFVPAQARPEIIKKYSGASKNIVKSFGFLSHRQHVCDQTNTASHGPAAKRNLHVDVSPKSPLPCFGADV